MAAIGREGGESRSRASRAARETGGMSDRELTRTVSREGDAGRMASADGRASRDDARDGARL
jgi:hypothetical protein